jgi:hypothetical protein
LYRLCGGALLPGPYGVAGWSIVLWSAVSWAYPMIRETHFSQFSPALEVAGSGLGEQPPFRLESAGLSTSPLRATMNVRPLAARAKVDTASIWCREETASTFKALHQKIDKEPDLHGQVTRRRI